MKKILASCMVLGLAATVVTVSGCASKSVQVNPVPGESGLLGTRGQVPAPLASPSVIKVVQLNMNEDVPAPSDALVAPEEPSLAPVVAPAVAPIAAPVEDGKGGEAFVPAPPVEDADSQEQPLITDLGDGKGVSADAAQVLMVYQVKKGDSLSSIARAHGVTWQEIATLNKLDGSALQVGQALTLPPNAIAADTAVEAMADTPAVEAKPAPAKPAKKAAAAKPAVKKTSARKALPADGKYTVKTGDSLSSIGHAYGIPYSQIRSDNNLKSDFLKVGQVLVLKPAVKKAAPKAASARKSAKAPAEQEKGLSADKYSVKSGDNLWTIARKFKVKTADLLEWNKLKSSRLHIGQVLIISKDGVAEAPKAADPVEVPAATPYETTPVVDLKPADNEVVLPAAAEPAPAAPIAVPAAEPAPAPVAEPAPVGEAPAPVAPAAVEPVTVTAAPAENIDAAVLPPAVNADAPKAAASAASYTVQEGETLSSILRKYFMSPEQFKELNPWYKDGEELKPGTEVKVLLEN